MNVIKLSQGFLSGKKYGNDAMMCHQERILANVLGVQIAQQFLRIIMNRD